MIRTLTLMAVLVCPALAQAPRQFMLKYEPVKNVQSMQQLSEEEQRILGEHGNYLKGLMAQGTLLFGGQALDPKGLWGFAIINAADGQAAAAVLGSDPGVKAHFFKGEVIPFRLVFDHGAPAAAK
jgi:uncharacterized protein YciI